MLLKNIAVDFDHTIVNGDKLLPGAKEALQLLRERGYFIMIYSCNRKRWIEKVLNQHEIPYDYIYDSDNDIGKPACDWYVDDRAIGFRGDWKAVTDEIQADYEREMKIREELLSTYGKDASSKAGKE